MGISNACNPDDNKTPDANTYAMVKERFEEHVVGVRGDDDARDHFVVSLKPQDADAKDWCQVFSAARLQSFCRNISYWRPPAETGGNAWTQHEFAPRWLKDDTRARVSRLVYDPLETPDDAYNLWGSMRATKLAPVPDVDVAELIEPFLRHIREVLAADDDALAEFVTDFVCNLIQRPAQPARVGLVFSGARRCGKGILFKFLRDRVLGEPFSYHTEGPCLGLLKQHNFSAPHRVLVQVDESFRKHVGPLSQTLAWETVKARGVDGKRTEMRNVCNLVCTTHDVVGGYIPPRSEESFVAARCSPKVVDDFEYFNHLTQHLGRNDVARAVYQFTMARDLSRFTPDFRRFTPLYLAQAAVTSIDMSVFMSALVNAAPACDIPAQTLHDHYKRFTNSDDNITVFGLKMHGWRQSVQKRRTRKGIVYRVNVDALRETLVGHREFYADASF